MKHIGWFVTLGFCCLGSFFRPSVFGQEVQIWTAEALIPFLAMGSGNEDKTIEISAIATIDADGRFLLAADDENAKLLVIEAKTGKVKKEIVVPGVTTKPKWEGLARDDRGVYYAVGAFSVKANVTDPDKLKARSRLFTFRLKMEGTDEQSIMLDPANPPKEWDISDALISEGYSAKPSENKVKVEGLAVRTSVMANSTKKR